MSDEHRIWEGVRQVLRDHLKIASSIGPDTDLYSDLELDSLKKLTFVIELENRFRICFGAGDEEGLRTIGDVVDLIARRIENEASDGGRPGA